MQVSSAGGRRGDDEGFCAGFQPLESTRMDTATTRVNASSDTNTNTNMAVTKSSPNPHAPPPICDDALASVLSYLDLQSATRFSKCCSSTLRRRVFGGGDSHGHGHGHGGDNGAVFESHWRERFDASLFSPSPHDDVGRGGSGSGGESYHSRIVHRRGLFRTLRGGSSSDPKCSLPDRCFKFVPLRHPPLDEYSYLDVCSLTNAGDGTEVVLLDPFRDEISVFDLAAHLNALALSRLRRLSGEEAEDGEAWDRMPMRGQLTLDEGRREVLLPPTDMGFADDRNATVDRGDVMTEWMGVEAKQCPQRSASGGGGGGSMISALRTVFRRSPLEGSLWVEWQPRHTEVLAWRERSHRRDGTGPGRRPDGCGSGRYDELLTCRLPGGLYYADVCCAFDVVYAAVAPSVGDDGGDVLTVPTRSRTVGRYSLHNSTVADSASSGLRCCGVGRPDVIMNCASDVSSFAVDRTGEHLVVGTEAGTVEVWSTGLNLDAGGADGGGATLDSSSLPQRQPRRLQILDIASLMSTATSGGDVDAETAIRDTLEPDRVHVAAGGPIMGDDVEDGEAGEEEEDETLDYINDLLGVARGQVPVPLNDGRRPEQPYPYPVCAVDRVHVPSNPNVSATSSCGFVTVQSSIGTLTVWQPTGRARGDGGDGGDDSDRFELAAIVRTSIGRPRVVYDGRRLLVHGIDDVGPVIEVYHVLSTPHDRDDFSPDTSSTVDAYDDDSSSPTITNIRGRRLDGGERREVVKLVNRIRHRSMQGLDDHEASLTANERYLVVNTRTGGRVRDPGVVAASVSSSSSRSPSTTMVEEGDEDEDEDGYHSGEGLLVIDLMAG